MNLNNLLCINNIILYCSYITDMIMHYLFDIVTLCVHVQLPKVIDERSHARWEIQHTIYQLTKRDIAYIS